ISRCKSSTVGPEPARRRLSATSATETVSEVQVTLSAVTAIDDSSRTSTLGAAVVCANRVPASSVRWQGSVASRVRASTRSSRGYCLVTTILPAASVNRLTVGARDAARQRGRWQRLARGELDRNGCREIDGSAGGRRALQAQRVESRLELLPILTRDVEMAVPELVTVRLRDCLTVRRR